MPRDMFGDVVKPPNALGSRSWYTVSLSIIVHTLIIGAIVIIPLMAAGVLPMPRAVMTFVAANPLPVRSPPLPRSPSPAPAPPPGEPPIPRQAADSTPEPTVDVSPSPALGETTRQSQPETRAPAADIGGRRESGGEGASPGIGIESGQSDASPLRPRPTPALVVPLRVGGHIKPPTKVKDVNPIYPSIAQSARIQGIVVIEATIAQNGRVQEARVLRSIPLLDQAALDAVKQWQYLPTLLNGVPVAVVVTVTVNFVLQ